MRLFLTKGIIIFCLFFLVKYQIIQAQQLSNDAVRLYNATYTEFHDLYFNNSDFSFSNSHKQKLKKLYDFSFVKNDPVYHARIQYLDALIKCNEIVPQYNEAISLIDSALIILSKEKYPKEYAKLLLLKANAYVVSSTNYVDAYKYSYEILKILDKKEDAAFVGLTYNYLTLIWARFGEWENALKNISEAEKTFKEGGYGITALFARSNAYSIRIRTKNDEEIRSEIKQDLQIAEFQNDTTASTYLNIVLSKSYTMENELDSAYKYLSKALNYIDHYHAPKTTRKADVLYSLGKLFYLKEDYPKAIAYLDESLPYIRQSRMLSYESGTTLMLSKIYEHYGNSDLAYDYLKQSVLLKDSLAIMDKRSEVQRIKNHTELMNYQQQMEIAEQKAEIRKINSLLIIFVLLFVLIIIIFTLVQINREKKMKELKIQQLDHELKNEEMNNRLEKMQMEKQMEEKEREIATSQLLISEKNKMLEQMLETFQPFYKSKDISEKIWKQMKMFVSNNLNKETGWERSKFHFEKVHPDFFKKLKEQFPHLTENELRLCAYIRIGMRTKDIAEMLSIDHKSVITNRYHLKKKMAFGKEQTLDDYIRNI